MARRQRSIVDDTRKATTAVVRIHAHGYSETDVRSILDPRFAVPEEWTGSGFFIRVNGVDGYILTNSHVARNSTSLEIKSILTSDELFKVQVVGLVADLEPDIALLSFVEGERERFLKISKQKHFPFLQAAPAEIQRGEEVKTIGYPLGVDEPHISGGEISNFIAGTGDTTERLVTDAAINPGNSGGPSLILGGGVVGINTSIIEGAENIGFITPIRLAKNVLQVFLKNEEAGLSRLGVFIQKNSEPNAHHLGQSRVEGVIVRKVCKKSPAALMGLRPLDVVLSINGRSVDRHGNILGEHRYRKRNLYDILHEVPVGELISVRVFRKGKILERMAKSFLWESDEFSLRPSLKDRMFMSFGGVILQEVSADMVAALSSLGYNRDIIYRDFFTDKSKLIVTHICTSSPAEDLGIHLGDFLVRAQGHKVKNIKSLQRVLGKAQKKSVESFLFEFSSGAIASFSASSIVPEDFLIRKFGQGKFTP